MHNKGLVVITQIIYSVLFGKHFFEVAELFFVSSILLYSEAWVNLSDTEMRTLKILDEMMLSKLLESDANTGYLIYHLGNTF